MSNTNNSLYLEELCRKYGNAETSVTALDKVSLSISAGEFVAITGTSGSGKTTLMHLIGCLDQPTSGSYYLDGADVSKLSSNELAKVRNQKIGFIFQKFNLLPDLSAQDNVALPALYAGVEERLAQEKARELLKLVELDSRIDHHPFEMSGGQQQRVAIARSLINDPALLLADEPTGNLDSQTTHAILDLFTRLNHEHGKTIIMVTHEDDVAARAKRIITLKDGQITQDRPM